MQDDELELEESEVGEPYNFPPAERKIVTQPYDMSVQTLLEQWDQKLLLIPDIQREYVWDNGRASRLIESLVLNIPIPPLYFAETQDAKFEVIDGHQRVKSVVRFLANEFALSGLRVLSEYTRTRFHQLPQREQRFLRNRSLRVIVLSHESHPNMKFEIFERLNTGGISLNAQELRNSLYRGSFNNLLKELVYNDAFRIAVGSGRPRKRMVDQELALRFLALRDRLGDYRPPLKRFLNEYMLANRDADASFLNAREAVFAYTMQRIEDTLGARAFRLIDEDGEPLRDAEGRPLPRGVNRALFDAQAVAFSWIVPGTPLKTKAIVQSISRMMRTDSFQQTVQKATGDRARVFERIAAVVAVLKKAGASLGVPHKLG